MCALLCCSSRSLPPGAHHTQTPQAVGTWTDLVQRTPALSPPALSTLALRCPSSLLETLETLYHHPCSSG